MYNVCDMRDGSSGTLHGRLIYVRTQGGIAFGKLQDSTGRMQVGFRKADWPTVEEFKAFVHQLHIGTIVRLTGSASPSKTNELTFWAVPEGSAVLQQSLLPWPDKFHGLVGDESKIRKRYLDCVLDQDTMKVFNFRHNVIQLIRNSLVGERFVEVETPILAKHASGANARPFQTHLNAKDTEMYLRIAPETYLKRYVAAGFDRVFEIGKQFRNEGVDPSHLPEFTSVEWYGAYMTHMDNMELFKDMFADLCCLAYSSFFKNDGSSHISSEMILTHQGVAINLNQSRTCTYRSLFEEYLGEWPEGLTWKERDLLFKQKIRPNLINPTYVTDYPAEMAPLAARNEKDSTLVDMWQLVIGGWEVVKCYQELVDPVLQEQLLKQQMLEKASDPEAMDLEEDFLECMKYGMPPMSGLGLGIDRLVCLLAGQTTLRDVVMFPILL